jgi:hypothetical protein
LLLIRDSVADSLQIWVCHDQSYTSLLSPTHRRIPDEENDF